MMIGRLTISLTAALIAGCSGPSAYEPLSEPPHGQPDPTIQRMIGQVSELDLYRFIAALSGEMPVRLVNSDSPCEPDYGDSLYYIRSRYTLREDALTVPTRYVYNYMDDLGLRVEFHNWVGRPGTDVYNYIRRRNVVGNLRGLVSPESVVVVCAHLDAISGIAEWTPGADDNASGCAAVMVAAGIMSRYHWRYTMRFVFFTGEEQLEWGSTHYARQREALGEAIILAVNLDMIAYDGNHDSRYDIQYCNDSWPCGSTYELALEFADIVDTYGIGLVTYFKLLGPAGSDHVSFWRSGYKALGIFEDYYGGDHTPYMHTEDDVLSTLDIPYCAKVTRAAIAFCATAAECVGPYPQRGVKRELGVQIAMQ